MSEHEPLGPREYNLGALAPLFCRMKEHLIQRTTAGRCSPEEALTLDELMGACPAAPNGWIWVSHGDGRITVTPARTSLVLAGADMAEIQARREQGSEQ